MSGCRLSVKKASSSGVSRAGSTVMNTRLHSVTHFLEDIDGLGVAGGVERADIGAKCIAEIDQWSDL